MGADDKQFIGRERVVREIVQGVLAETPSSFSLVGSKLSGKSRLLQYLASEEGPLLSDEFKAWRPYAFEDGSRVLAFRVDCAIPAARENFLVFLLSEVIAAIKREGGLPFDLNAQPDASASTRLLGLMRQVTDGGYRAVLLLDNFDRVFASLAQDAVNELRPLTFQTALVVASEQPLHDLDRSLAASPLFNIMTQVFLGLVEPDTARRWLEEVAREGPDLSACIDELLEITGTHPYLLRLVGDIAQEVQEMLPGNVEVGPEHLPLIRLRLAEHGRLLFETMWRRVQSPPARIKQAVLMNLLQRMAQDPLNLVNVTREEQSTLNWLINQGMVVYGSAGNTVRYTLFSPLLTDYLAERLAPIIQSTTSAASNGAGRLAVHGAGEGAGHGELKAIAQGAASALEPAFMGGLTRIEASLLSYLQAHSNQVVSPEQLLADVWRRPDATPRRVQEAIRRLRLALEEANPAVGVIENDRGRGYRFVPAAS